MNERGGGPHSDLDAATRDRVRKSLLAKGVVIPDPDCVYVDEAAEVDAGTVLLSGTYLRGPCKIGSNCRIGPDCWIEDSTIESGSTVWYSVLESARVREGSTVGPFSHLRRDADVGPEARIGNFVEVKAARIARGAKAGHLAYVGDAEVGAEANIGAGVVTCNFDGAEKHRTIIEDGAFIGTNASLVAPVRIGKDAVVGAGSTITDDVPPRSLALGRARQVVKRRSEKDVESEEAQDV